MWKTKETQIQSLGQEDPLEKDMATHSSILAWRIPWTEEPGRLQSTGPQVDLLQDCLYAILHTEQALFHCWGNPPSAKVYVCVTIQKQDPYIHP